MQRPGLIRIEENQLFSTLFGLLIGFEIIKIAVLQLVRKVVVLPFKLDSAMIYGLLVLLVLSCSKKIFLSVTQKSILFLFGLTFLIGFSYIRNIESGDYFKEIMKDFVICVMYYLMGKSITDDKGAVESFRIVSFFITVSSIVILQNGLGEASHSLWLSYLILPAIIISIDACFDITQKHRILYGVNAVASTILCVYSGSRGPFLCIAIFLILRIISSLKDEKQRVYSILTVLIAGFTFYYYFDAIVLLLNRYANVLGMSDRVIQSFISGNFAYDNGRFALQKAALYLLVSNPIYLLFGTGVAADRIVLANYFHSPSSNLYGMPPHFFFIEVLFQFGIIAGGAICIGIIKLILKASKVTKEKGFDNLFLILLSIGFFPLFVSGSYITRPLFFLFLSYCVNIVQHE